MYANVWQDHLVHTEASWQAFLKSGRLEIPELWEAAMAAVPKPLPERTLALMDRVLQACRVPCTIDEIRPIRIVLPEFIYGEVLIKLFDGCLAVDCRVQGSYRFGDKLGYQSYSNQQQQQRSPSNLLHDLDATEETPPLPVADYSVNKASVNILHAIQDALKEKSETIYPVIVTVPQFTDLSKFKGQMLNGQFEYLEARLDGPSRVLVNFKNVEEAKRAVSVLDGMQFNGHTLEAYQYTAIPPPKEAGMWAREILRKQHEDQRQIYPLKSPQNPTSYHDQNVHFSEAKPAVETLVNSLSSASLADTSSMAECTPPASGSSFNHDAAPFVWSLDD